MTLQHSSPLLSIAIPTKNRYEYLIPCLRTLITLKQKFDSIEIVVQDNNSDNDQFLEFLNSNSRYISYHHTPESISVVDNCDLAIANCTGEFICFIGDDDSVPDAIVDVCRWMHDNDIESCLGTIARFNWPDMQFLRHQFKNLSIPGPKRYTGPRDVNTIRNTVLRKGGIEMMDLPKVYHAIVSRKALLRLKQTCGSFFPGPSPDMANAIGLTLILKNHIIIDTPVIVSGFSFKSTGGQGSRGAHHGRIEDISHLPKDTAAQWDERIPRYWTAETIYAESILKAITRCGFNQYTDLFNFPALYAAIAMYHTSLFNIVLPFINTGNFMYVATRYIQIFLKRSGNFIKNILETKLNISSQTTFDNVSNIEDAVRIVNEHSRTSGRFLSHHNITIN